MGDAIAEWSYALHVRETKSKVPLANFVGDLFVTCNRGMQWCSAWIIDGDAAMASATSQSTMASTNLAARPSTLCVGVSTRLRPLLLFMNYPYMHEQTIAQ